MTGSLGRFVILALSGAALTASPGFAQPAKVTEFKVGVWSLSRTLVGEDPDPRFVRARAVGPVFLTIRDKDNLDDEKRRLRVQLDLARPDNIIRYPHVNWDDPDKRVTAVRIDIEQVPSAGPNQPRALKSVTLDALFNVDMVLPVVMPLETAAEEAPPPCECPSVYELPPPPAKHHWFRRH
jgi:hypothetical protein